MASRSVAIFGPLGPPQLACLRSWRRLGWQTTFVHLDQFPLFSPLQRVADKYYFLGKLQDLTTTNASQALDILSQVQAVASVSEALTKKIWLLSLPYRGSLYVLSASPNVLDRLESKSWQAKKADSAGFNVLPTLTFRPVDAPSIRWEEYPVVLRPDRAHAVKPLFKMKMCSSRTELISFCQSLHPESGELVVQPYRPLPGICIHGYRDTSGGINRHMGFLADFKIDGFAVSLIPFNAPNKVITACEEFERSIGLVGVFHYDMLWCEETQSAWFLEVNPRLGGTTGKVYASGYDEPAYLLSAFGLEEIPLPEIGKVNYSISRIAALKFMKALLQGQLSALDYPMVSTMRSVIKLLGKFIYARDEVVHINDILGTLAFLAQRN